MAVGETVPNEGSGNWEPLGSAADPPRSCCTLESSGRLTAAWEEPADKSVAQALLVFSLQYRYRNFCKRFFAPCCMEAIIRATVFDVFERVILRQFFSQGDKLLPLAGSN